MHHPTDRIIHTTAFVAPVVEHWLDITVEYRLGCPDVTDLHQVSVGFLNTYVKWI